MRASVALKNGCQSRRILSQTKGNSCHTVVDFCVEVFVQVNISAALPVSPEVYTASSMALSSSQSCSGADYH